MDRRAEAEAEAVDAGDLRRRAGLARDATHMAAKIRWLKGALGSDRKAMRFHQPVSYPVARLTGEHVFAHGLASTTMLYSLARRERRMLIVDYTKFEARSLEVVFPLDHLDELVTDAPLPPVLGDALSAAGVTVHVARAPALRQRFVNRESRTAPGTGIC